MSASASSATSGHPSIDRYMDTSPFWEGARAGRLMLQYCHITRRYQFYPRPTSIHTGRKSLEWRQASGRARLAAWTVDRLNALDTGVKARIHAFVDLEEGARLLTWLVDCDGKQLAAGMELRLHWTSLPNGVPWPSFAPQATSAG